MPVVRTRIWQGSRCGFPVLELMAGAKWGSKRQVLTLHPRYDEPCPEASVFTGTAPPIQRLAVPVTPVVSMFGVAICIQPSQQSPNAAVCESDARIRSSVVEIESVAVRCQRVPTWKDHVLHIAAVFVVRFGRKYPGIPSNQAFFGLFEIEQGQTKPVDGARRRPTDAVIEHQPTSRRFDGGRGHANLVRVPPRTAAGFQHELVIAPMPQVRRVRDPAVSCQWRHGTVDQGPKSVDFSWQQGSVLVIWRHDDAKPLEGTKIFGEGQGHARAAAGIGSVGYGVLLKFGYESDAWIFDAPELFRILFRVGQQRWFTIDLPAIDAVHRTRDAQVRMAATVFHPA